MVASPPSSRIMLALALPVRRPDQDLLGAPPVLLQASRPSRRRPARPAGRRRCRCGPTTTAAAAWSWVEKMLQEAQRTSAPSATRVSIRTAVWIVMCSEPAIFAPGERLALGVALTHRHQAGHLVLGEGDLGPAEVGQGQVCDLEVHLLLPPALPGRPRRGRVPTQVRTGVRRPKNPRGPSRRAAGGEPPRRGHHEHRDGQQRHQGREAEHVRAERERGVHGERDDLLEQAEHAGHGGPRRAGDACPAAGSRRRAWRC